MSVLNAGKEQQVRYIPTAHTGYLNNLAQNCWGWAQTSTGSNQSWGIQTPQSLHPLQDSQGVTPCPPPPVELIMTRLQQTAALPASSCSGFMVKLSQESVRNFFSPHIFLKIKKYVLLPLLLKFGVTWWREICRGKRDSFSPEKKKIDVNSGFKLNILANSQF